MRKILPIIFLMLLLVSCTVTTGETEGVTVYFLPPVETGDAAPVAVVVPFGLTPVQTAIETLLSGYGDYASPYVEGVLLLSAVNDGGMLNVQFSSRYDDMPTYQQAAANACLTLTLCELDGIEAVRVGNGQPLSVADILYGGITLEPLARELTLYFSDGSSSYVTGETRNVLLRESVALDSFVIGELLKGPNSKGLESALPKDTRLISIMREGGICHVNLSEEYRKLYEQSFNDELRAVRAIASTLCGLDGIDEVQLLCEGERLYGGATVRPQTHDSYSTSCTIYLAARGGLERAELLVSEYSLQGILEALIGGADGNGFLSPLPKGTLVTEAVQEDSSFFVDLKTSEEPDEDACRAVAMSIAESFEHTETVNIAINGVPYAELSF